MVKADDAFAKLGEEAFERRYLWKGKAHGGGLWPLPTRVESASASDSCAARWKAFSLQRHGNGACPWRLGFVTSRAVK